MARIAIVNKGESVTFSFDRDGATTDGFICTIVVKEFTSDTALITRVVALDTDTDAWSGFLTSTETALLSPGTTYRLMAILANATTGEQDEIETRLSITETWAA